MMEPMSAENKLTEQRAALDSLFRAEYADMVRLAYTLVRDPGEAEDLVQDSFAAVAPYVSDVDEPGAYLRTTVVHRCNSALRRRRVRERHRPDPPASLSSGACEVWDVLHTLTGEQQTALVLRYFGRYAPSEIAETLGVPASTVRSHLRRGLAALRKELDR